MKFARRGLLMSSAAALTIAACAPGDGAASGAGPNDRPGDMAIGAANAPITLIEYASVTCSHCRDFHEAVYPALKSEFIETGKVRFVFREFPTAPPELAAGGFLVARCAGATPEQYFARIDTMFDQQPQLFEAYARGAAREHLRLIALAAGLNDEQFDACVRDEAGYKRINETVKHGVDTFKISGTPSFVLNGTLITDPAFLTVDGMRTVLTEAAAKAR